MARGPQEHTKNTDILWSGPCSSLQALQLATTRVRITDNGPSGAGCHSDHAGVARYAVVTNENSTGLGILRVSNGDPFVGWTDCGHRTDLHTWPGRINT